MTEMTPERYRVTPAPAPILLVQSLLNTAGKPDGSDPDLLRSTESAAPWLRLHDVHSSGAGLGLLRSVRDALRRALVQRDDGARDDDRQSPWASVDVPASLQLDADGTVRIAPQADGVQALAQRVLTATHDAQLTGAWRRLKVCRNPACSVAFWDSSRNTSGVWHDVRTCGNTINLRRSRARRAAGETPTE